MTVPFFVGGTKNMAPVFSDGATWAPGESMGPPQILRSFNNFYILLFNIYQYI